MCAVYIKSIKNTVQNLINNVFLLAVAINNYKTNNISYLSPI